MPPADLAVTERPEHTARAQALARACAATLNRLRNRAPAEGGTARAIVPKPRPAPTAGATSHSHALCGPAARIRRRRCVPARYCACRITAASLAMPTRILSAGIVTNERRIVRTSGRLA
jgi:hypothetical protein